jgi:hypothetical protein
MIFNFKPKPLVVHCIVSEEMSHVYDYAPIQPANKFFPQWWKASAKTTIHWEDTNLQQSIKNCQGIQDHYGQGMIMPMWSDLAISTNGQGGIVSQFSDMISTNDYQGTDIRAGFRPDAINMKIQSPWRFRSDKDVYWNFLGVYWDQLERANWEVMPGTLEFYYNYGTNVNMLVDVTKGHAMIEHGQPLAHFFPLSERPLVIKNEMVSNREFDILCNNTRAISFINKYKTIRKAKRASDDEQAKAKCPFGFGSKK